MKARNLMAMMLAASAFGGMSYRPPRPPTGRKCALKDCSRLTTHNGGYCCAEHCRLDRQRRRADGAPNSRSAR